MTSVPVCCALIEDQGKVMIAQRPTGKHLAGQWEFPGGKIEEDESPVEALHREINEELGCQLTIIAALPPGDHAYPNGNITLHPFVAALAPGSPAPHPHEHAALRWLNREELSIATLAPADLPVLASYLNLPL